VFEKQCAMRFALIK